VRGGGGISIKANCAGNTTMLGGGIWGSLCFFWAGNISMVLWCRRIGGEEVNNHSLHMTILGLA